MKPRSPKTGRVRVQEREAKLSPSFGPRGLERRRAPRVAIPASAPLSVVGARLLNASPFGMLIESPVAMQRDTVLRLRLVISHRKLDVETRVAACTNGATRGTFGIGLEITQMPEEARRELEALLAGVTNPTPAG